ncbi:MAG: hypothetical protein SFW09_01655 [Hyphomicrobiaceae bacterium]|nr:hypothetical protein [Hyphomicrobiaceae bacterium]
MQFPLKIAFKILTFVPQMTVRDASCAEIGYVRQKLLAFKESVTVFADETQSQPIYTINADRVIDFTANYHFATYDGRPLGHLRREGFSSLWRAHYVISVGDAPTFEVREASAWLRMIDNLVSEIPFVGIFTGYFLNPKYHVTRLGGGDALLMTKKPALLETEFDIQQTGPISPNEQAAALLGIMMIILLERSRG